jgi:hypothetical protein
MVYQFPELKLPTMLIGLLLTAYSTLPAIALQNSLKISLRAVST